MQREVLLTGIGGQGIQLAAKTLAMAATAEGRQVLMSSHYGGEMRGGQTEASVIVADEGLRAVPILESAWSAFVMHGRYWSGVAARVSPGGFVAFNSSADADPGEGDWTAVGVPAGDLAQEIGAPMAAAFVLLGAYARLTGLVEPESLIGAMRDLVPPYRVQHVANNEMAIRSGAEAVEPAGDSVWAVSA